MIHVCSVELVMVTAIVRIDVRRIGLVRTVFKVEREYVFFFCNISNNRIRKRSTVNLNDSFPLDLLDLN